MEDSTTSQSDNGIIGLLTNGPIQKEKDDSENNIEVYHGLKGDKLESNSGSCYEDSRNELINLNSFERLNHTNNHINNDVTSTLPNAENTIRNVSENSEDNRTCPAFCSTASINIKEKNILPNCKVDNESTISESPVPINGLSDYDDNQLDQKNFENYVTDTEITSIKNCMHTNTHPLQETDEGKYDSVSDENKIYTHGKTEISNGISDDSKFGENVKNVDSSLTNKETQLTNDVSNVTDKEEMLPPTELESSMCEGLIKPTPIITNEFSSQTYKDKSSEADSEDESNSLSDSSFPEVNDKNITSSQVISEVNERLSNLSLSEKHKEEFLSKDNENLDKDQTSLLNIEEKLEITPKVDNGSNSHPSSDDDSLNFNLQEICNKNRNIEGSPSLDEENLLGISNNLTSEIDKNLYETSLGLEDIINAAVSEIGLEFNKETEGFLSIDSDSNLVTASEGIISSCSPSTSSENSQQISESSNANCQIGSLQEMSQHSSLEENQDFEDKEGFIKRGDADGCSLSSEPSKANSNTSEDKAPFISKIDVGEALLQNQENDSNCSCKRFVKFVYW